MVGYQLAVELRRGHAFLRRSLCSLVRLARRTVIDGDWEALLGDVQGQILQIRAGESVAAVPPLGSFQPTTHLPHHRQAAEADLRQLRAADGGRRSQTNREPA